MSDRAGASLSSLIETELLALRTIRTPWILAGVTVLVTLVLALTPVIDSGKNGAASIGTSAAMLACSMPSPREASSSCCSAC